MGKKESTKNDESGVDVEIETLDPDPEYDKDRPTELCPDLKEVEGRVETEEGDPDTVTPDP